VVVLSQLAEFQLPSFIPILPDYAAECTCDCLCGSKSGGGGGQGFVARAALEAERAGRVVGQPVASDVGPKE